MFEWFKALFKPTVKKPSEGVFYIGEGFGNGLGKSECRGPDQNGKLYRFHMLICEGEHKGKYTPLGLVRLGPTDEQLRSAEQNDILRSGFQLYALDRSEMEFKTVQYKSGLDQ